MIVLVVLAVLAVLVVVFFRGSFLPSSFIFMLYCITLFVAGCICLSFSFCIASPCLFQAASVYVITISLGVPLFLWSRHSPPPLLGLVSCSAGPLFISCALSPWTCFMSFFMSCLGLAWAA